MTNELTSIATAEAVATAVAASQTGIAGPRYRGVGESIEAAVPAAIGNAAFDAPGVRMRQVPLTPVKVRRALAASGRLYQP